MQNQNAMKINALGLILIKVCNTRTGNYSKTDATKLYRQAAIYQTN